MGWAQAAVVALALLAGVVPIEPGIVERWFSTAFYRAIQRLLTPITNLAPFAIFDLLTLAAAALLAIGTARAVRRARRERSLRPLLTGAIALVTATAAVYLAFLGLWGLNYRRVPMTERLVLERPAPATDAVAALGLEAVGQLNTLYQDAHAHGWQVEPWRDPILREAYARVQRQLTGTDGAVPGRLKWSLYGPYFRWTSVDGMVNPFALEVLRNPDLLPFEVPFVAAHEWAHLAGFADESEANFVGWLTCLRAGAGAQYSAWQYLYWQISGEVPQDERARLREALDTGPRRDLDAIVERVRRGQLPRLRQASWQMYDQYLRANRVEEGIRSYGEVVTLILRARFDDGWTPVRRTTAPSR